MVTPIISQMQLTPKPADLIHPMSLLQLMPKKSVVTIQTFILVLDLFVSFRNQHAHTSSVCSLLTDNHENHMALSCHFAGSASALGYNVSKIIIEGGWL